MTDARIVVEQQLGRPARGKWRVATHCSHGFPTVIATSPRLADGSPFPTLYWLTCPHLVEQVDDAESAGGVAQWASRIEGDPSLRFEVLASDQQYRAAREMEGRGDDPCSDVGVAGQADPGATKCLHAHVATAVAGIPDPIGRQVMSGLSPECDGQTCAAFQGAVSLDSSGIAGA